MLLTPLLLAALQTGSVSVDVSTDTVPALEPDSAAMATAYADAATRDLVRLARDRRGATEAALFRYQATVRHRASVRIRALRRDRLLYRRETASEVDWRRDGPTRVEILGAREVAPVVHPDVHIPEDLDGWARSMVPRPGDDRLILNPQGSGFAWHPLLEGGEAVYRYAMGDSTRIRLPDGREIVLVELRVTPRERDIRLITGSFWIETDEHAIVQAVYRPSREFDLERDLPRIDPSDADDVDEIPGLFKPIRFDLRYMTVEYGLWEMRWWLPRLIALDGWLQVGPARFPMDFEMAYSDYRVEGDRYGLPELPPVIRQLAGDSSVTPRPYEYGMVVEVPDSAALLESALLPGSIYDEASGLISEQELEELARRVGSLPSVPWEVGRPRATWPWQLGRGLLRYNRVEGLSAGVRVDWDLTRVRLDATARTGTADPAPVVELGAEASTLRRTWRMAAYRRLAPVDAGGRPLGPGNSLNALLFGRDNGLYFRASGAELRVSPAPGEHRYDLRLYAERQSAADWNTEFSLPEVFGGSHSFQPNIVAAEATQVGISAATGIDRGLDPAGVRWGADLELTAETGDFSFLRPGLATRLAVPVPGALLAAVELAGGTTLGSGDRTSAAPVQSLWYLGGPATVRGFPAGYMAGVDQVRARAELATEAPSIRLAAFSDAGWAGTRSAFDSDDIMASVGVGASFLDGMVRMDLARTLQPVRQWRLELYVDALF